MGKSVEMLPWTWAILSLQEPSLYSIPYLQANMPPAVDPGLRIAADAIVGGNLTYTSPSPQTGAIHAQPAGQTIYQTPEPTSSEVNAHGQTRITFRIPILKNLFNALRDLITLLILGALVLWLLPKVFALTVAQARSKTLPSAGVGLLEIIVAYAGSFFAVILLIGVGLLLTLITLGGLSKVVFGVGFSGIALIMTIFTLLLTYGSKLVVAYLVGDLLLEQIAPNAANKRIWALLIGVFIYVFLRAIPIFGWLVSLVATVIGLGAMWYAFMAYRRKPAVEETA